MSIDPSAIRRRHDEAHEHDGGCDLLDLLDEVERLEEARDINLRGLAEFAAQLTEQRERANKAESELAAHQDAVDAVKALAVDLGPAWWEWIAHPTATTHAAYVHESGSVYLPDGEFSADDFYGAEATGNAHRLIRADDIRAALDEHLGEG